MKVINRFCIITIFLGLLFGCDNNSESNSNNIPAALESTLNTSTSAKEIDYSSVQLKLLDVSEREVGKSNAIVFLFNAPIEANQNFSNYIEITPPLVSPVLSADGRQLQYNGIYPETKYQINVIAGLKAEHGSQLRDVYQKTVNTRAMAPLISFKSQQGAILVPGHTDDLGIYSVNVPEVDLNIYRVKLNELANFLQQYKQIASSGAYYYHNDNRAKMVEHLYTARVKTAGKANQRQVTSFSIADKDWANESGVYFATLGKPGVFEFDAATWFSVSSIGLQIRQFPKEMHIITQDIKTGAPLKGIEVALLDGKSQRYAVQTTNQQGVVNVKNIKNLSLIVARKGKEVTVLPYKNPRFDLTDFNVGDLPFRDNQLFVYSERDIYRPGETLTLSILRRDADGQVDGSQVSVELYKPDGSKYKSIWLKATDSKNGYYQYSVNLPKSTPLGNWQAKVTTRADNNYQARFHFKVEEFLPERLRLTLGEADKLQRFSPKQGLKVLVLGEYLYGAPAAGNRLETRGNTSAWTQPFEQWPDYYIGDSNGAKKVDFALADTMLDDTGKHSSIVKQPWENWNIPTKVRLHYSLFESGGRAINRFYDSLLWPKKSFIAVKPGFKNAQSTSNSSIQFNLLKLDKNASPITQGEVKTELIREEKRYFWTYNNNNGWHYERIEKEYVVDSQILSFVDKKPLTLNQSVEWGDYRLELTDLATLGKTIYRFRAGEAWYNDWQNNSKTIRPDRVNLALDKESYLPGETLLLRIAAPYAGNALITIETDSVLFQQQFEVGDGESEVKLTVPKGLVRHDAYITAFVIAPSKTHSESVSKRSFGIIHLPLTRTERHIDLKLDVPERWAPNQQVIVKVRANDATGNPLSGHAKVTLAAVDSGVLNVTGYKVADPYSFFYGQRKYQGVITDMYDQVMTPLLADKASLRWGGDAALTRGGEKSKNEAKIVSLFSGLVSLKDGVAEIPLQLPVFDGELNLTVVAFDNAQFAKVETTVKVTSPVVLQVALPKFMATGDRSEIVLDVSNVTALLLQGEFSLNVAGQLASQNNKRSLTLEPNQKQTLHFTLQALQDVGVGELQAKFVMADEVIERQWSLPVRATQAAEFNREKALLMPGDNLHLPAQALAPFIDATQQLQLFVGLSPNLNATEHWRYLTAYPYGCLEQTTSKSRPFAAVLTQDGKATSINDVSVDDINQKAQGAIERYRELQRADGSFGLWSKTSKEEHWLTAYATEFLYNLKDKGMEVPDAMLNSATKRLESYVTSRARHQVKTWSSNPQHYDVAYRAYAAYVLAKQAKITLGPLRDIAEQDLLNAEGKLPGVHLGLAMLMTGSEKEGSTLILQALKKKRSHSYLGDYGSEIRDQAMAIDALVTSDLVNEELKLHALLMLPELVSEIQQQQWLSTQERSAILLLAMTIQQQYNEQPWQGDLTINKQITTLHKNGVYRQDIDITKELQATFTNTGDLPLYVSFDWMGVKKQADYDVYKGIHVETAHFLVNNNEATKLADSNTLHSGDLLLTRITLRSDVRVPDALVVNLMPAGVELENQNLLNSLKIAEITIDGEKIAIAADIAHEEFRDDRYVAAVDLPEQRVQTLYVLSRAVNPGSYVFPAVQVESMYKPSVRGIGGSIKQINVKEKP